MSMKHASLRTMRRRRRAVFVASTAVVAMVGAALPASAAPGRLTQVSPTTLDLYAVTGSVSLPGQTVPVPVWGYSTTGSSVIAPGGPTLVSTEGIPVALTLHNQLTAPTSLVVRGQAMASDLTGVVGGGTKTYSFTPTEPGTYIYEAGPLNVGGGTEHQVAMGLYGVLVVNPTTGTAHDSDVDAVVLTSELDPALNKSANPSAFDMRNFAPKYSLVNGKPYPTGIPVLATASANERVLVRYVNAGVNYHSMSVLGANQRIVADDGHTLAQPYSVVAQTVGPGQTIDAVITVPAGAGGTMLSVFDANLQLRNSGRRPATLSARPTAGGAVAFIQVGTATTPTDTVGPVSSNLAVVGGVLSAQVSDASTGGANVTAAEYSIDTLSPAGSGVGMSATFGSPTVSVSATLSLAPGSHTIHVRGQDAAGNWGLPASIAVTSDTQAPVISGVAITPSPTNGLVDVALHATASDVTTGGSTIASAGYWIDGGAPAPMAVNLPAVMASLDATIPAATVVALSEGPHTITVEATDAAGNAGAVLSTVRLLVDKTGPAMTLLSSTPNPTNGKIGVNSSTNAVRVIGTATDPLLGMVSSGIVRTEGFIGAPPGAVGTGFLFVPADGSWGSTTESVSVDIPLATIASLPAGDNTIHVHSKDAAGNWGPYSTITLRVDKDAPTITSVTLTPSTIGSGTASVALTVVAADATTSVTGGQYWIDGTATLPAVPTALSGLTATVNTAALTPGTHTISTRVKDAAGNWSTVSSKPIVVIQAVADSTTVTANTSGSQTVNVTSAIGLLVNDQPLGVAGRAVRLATVPIRIAGTGTGAMSVSCPATSLLGTAATPTLSGQTVCTNGAYRLTLTGTGATNTAKRASKRGTYQFTYTMTLNGASSTATVTITVI